MRLVGFVIGVLVLVSGNVTRIVDDIAAAGQSLSLAWNNIQIYN